MKMRRRDFVLDGFLHKARAKAAGAHEGSFGSTLDEGLDGLKVGAEDPFGSIIRVADVITDLTFFPTYVTGISHDVLSSLS